jgi:transposase
MELLAMSRPELTRLETLAQVQAGALSQRDAAARLGLSERQVRRLERRLEEGGPAALGDRRRGKRSNRQLDPALIAQALALVRAHYADFGPSFANEKLRELHGLVFSTETLRQALIQEGLWQPHRRRTKRIHPPRERRPQFGELIQLDGSPHDWFEGRGPRCSLLVLVDDATSALVGLHFAPNETTVAYFEVLRTAIARYGRPLALYSDRHSIFRVPQAVKTVAETQVARALRELEIELICANSPQAKGRVERANRTLQARLRRELRLRNISTIETANGYLPEFIASYNERFACGPQLQSDAHRSAGGFDLDAILAVRHERRLSKDRTIQIDRTIYIVEDQRVTAGSRVTLIERPQHAFELRVGPDVLTLRRLRSLTEQSQIRDAKSLDAHLDRRHRETMPQMARKPPANHPWRRTPLTLPPPR